MKEKGESHTYYKFYTSYAVVDAIINSHSIFLSKGDNWNDLQDRNNFNPDDDSEMWFGLCMSFAKSENVAMWMLYSRNDGYMIDFGKNIIKECLSCSKISCGRIRNNKYEELCTVKDSEFTAEILDIVYYGESKNGDDKTFYIKRSDEIVQNCSKRIINQIKYCKKTLPWQYECECRFIVSVKKSIKEIERCDTIKIRFDDSLVEKLKNRIYYSPNHNGKYIFEKSKLSGKIQWNI